MFWADVRAGTEASALSEGGRGWPLLDHETSTPSALRRHSPSLVRLGALLHRPACDTALLRIASAVPRASLGLADEGPGVELPRKLLSERHRRRDARIAYVHAA
jgi:hypothetical protein